MKKNHKFSRAALAALVLASANPIASEAIQSCERQEVFFAQGGCGSSSRGCGAVTSSSARDAPVSAPVYDEATGTFKYDKDEENRPSQNNRDQNKENYPPNFDHASKGNLQNANNQPIGYLDSGPTTNTSTRMNYGTDQMNYESGRYNNDNRFNNNYANQTWQTRNSPRYNPYQGDFYGNSSYPHGAEYGGTRPSNVQYQMRDNLNRNVPVNSSPINAVSPVTSDQFVSKLDNQTRQIYERFDPATKDLALQLANKNNYKNQNQAVIEAARIANSNAGQW